MGYLFDAFDRPCLRDKFMEDDYKYPWQIDGKTVYVNDFAVEKFPEAPPDYVLIEIDRIAFSRMCY